MLLLYFFLETSVGLSDLCPYMYVRRGSFSEGGLNSNLAFQNLICRAKWRFKKTSLLQWRLITIIVSIPNF